jgi:hypothetical protein
VKFWRKLAEQYSSMVVRNSDQMDFLEAEVERLREALLSYAAVQFLPSKSPGQIQRDLRAIAGEEHIHVAMISDSRCLICRHDLRHEVHTRLPQKSALDTEETT